VSTLLTYVYQGDYSEKDVVKLSMIKQLKKVFANFPEDIGRPASSPASDHLFRIRDPEETEKEGKFVNDEKKVNFITRWRNYFLSLVE
jgi:hypothetical protein